MFYLHQNKLIIYFQQTNRVYSQILYSKHSRFSNVLMLTKDTCVIFHKASEISFIYGKKNKGPSKICAVYGAYFRKDCLLKQKKLYLWDTSETILLFYLENLCTSFCLIIFYDLKCQNPFEDRLYFPFSTPFKITSVNWDKNVLWNEVL